MCICEEKTSSSAEQTVFSKTGIITYLGYLLYLPLNPSPPSHPLSGSLSLSLFSLNRKQIYGAFMYCTTPWPLSVPHLSTVFYCLVGLVVRRPPRERKIPGLNPAVTGFFLRSSHTSDSKIGTPVATLPDA